MSIRIWREAWPRAAGWIRIAERLQHYQALVRTAVTLDALLDAEDNPSPLSAG